MGKVVVINHVTLDAVMLIELLTVRVPQQGPLRGRSQERDERLRQLARRLFGQVMPGVDAVAGDLDGPVLPDGEWGAIQVFQVVPRGPQHEGG